MIRAIIFDCFGVLATDGWIPFRDKYFKENKGEADYLNKRMNMGLISYKEFVGEIASLSGLSEKVVDEHIDSNAPNIDLIKYIKTLKPKYKIGMLSNAGANWMESIFTKEELSVFDASAVSFEIGAIKPDARSYEIIAEKLGVPIEECIFIDDQDRHCIGARDAGMQAIKYIDLEQMKTDLNKLIKA